jgi:predicted dehydrogenase
MPKAIFFLLVVLFASHSLFAQDEKPLRVGVAGLVHGHVGNILGHTDRKDIQIVGISESDAGAVKRAEERFSFDPAIVKPDIGAMLDAAKPEAVVVFTSIAGHIDVIRACAKRGIHVMVEKPLALNAAEAREIEQLAAKYRIHVLTNYETTWYPTTQEIQRKVAKGDLGEIRKMIACDGHAGPKEIGCGPDFLNWLTDPAQNGGGAIVDFGCYGANLMSWLMQGALPKSVFAVTQKFKTDPLYARVDDEATIVLAYDKAQGIIQASWNWPYNRKDLAVYGTGGTAIADDRTHLRLRPALNAPEQASELPLPEAPFDNEFTYFAAVVRGKVDPAGGLSSLPINVATMEILDAARKSAAEGKAVTLGN